MTSMLSEALDWLKGSKYGYKFNTIRNLYSLCQRNQVQNISMSGYCRDLPCTVYILQNID